MLLIIRNHSGNPECWSLREWPGTVEDPIETSPRDTPYTKAMQRLAGPVPMPRLMLSGLDILGKTLKSTIDTSVPLWPLCREVSSSREISKGNSFPEQKEKKRKKRWVRYLACLMEPFSST